jgi:glutaredoxin
MKKAHVILYSRPGCHLCHEAKEIILSVQRPDRFSFEEVNIDLDDALKESYGLEIPVVTINGVRAFKYRVTTEQLIARLSRVA